MDVDELTTYLDENSRVVSNFRAKMMAYEVEKNKRRQPAKRWNQTQLDRAVDKSQATFMKSVFDQLSGSISADKSAKEWATFIDDNEIADSLEESVDMIDMDEA